MNTPRPLVRLSRYVQWLRSGRILCLKEGTRSFTEIVASANTCAHRLHNGMVLYGGDSESPSSLASATAAKTLCSFHPQADKTPKTPVSEVPQEVLAELCKLVVRDISSLESSVIVRLLHCVLSSERYDQTFQKRVFREINTRLESLSLSVSELCDVIEALSTYMSAPQSLLDTAWHMFGRQASQARVTDIQPAYRTLSTLAPPGQAAVAVPYAFTQLDIAVNKCWRSLTPKDVTAIARAITLSNYDNPELIVPWLSENILSLSGVQLKEVIAMFDHLRYSTSRVSDLITQYTCAKADEIDGVLLGMIMEYFRLRAYLSKDAFDAVAKAIEKKPAELEKRDIFKILRVYGQLNYSPANLGVVLSKMERRFWQFNGVALLELMASFVYIERYPTNFYKDLLSLHFLAETFTGNVPEMSVRHMLELRAAFTVDRPSWKPLPMPLGHLTLSKEALAFHADVRDVLETFKFYFSQYWTPRNTPHMVDFVIRSVQQNIVTPKEEEASFAILCMLPIHYTVNTKTLLGAHAMKRRHLTKLGYTVIGVEYSKWNNASTDHKAYLRQLLSPHFVL